MYYNGEDIRNTRNEKRNNILKSFGVDIEKATAQIGETRQWADGLYRKVEAGKWVKVTNGKEKRLQNSTIIKKIKERQQQLLTDWNSVRKSFENSLENKFPKYTYEHNKFFQDAWRDKVAKDKFLQKIQKEQKDLNDEIKEIQSVAKIEEKKRREIQAGKQEIDEDDLMNGESVFKQSVLLLEKIDKEIPKRSTAIEIMPQVTIENYFLDTKTTFHSVLSSTDTWSDVSKKWDDMKKSGKYDYHQSPKSNSEYLIDKTNGDIYRHSDHWGKVASCDWDIVHTSDNVWDIAKSNIKDFKRKKNSPSVYLNPVYRTKMVEAAKLVLPQFRKLVTDNKDFYLTKQALQLVLDKTDWLYKELKYRALLSVEEIAKNQGKI